MVRSTLDQDESTIFHYGFLSSRTSGALKEYIDRNRVSEGSLPILRDAHQLLEDIITAQNFLGKEKESVAPSESALDAYSCALEVIVAHKSEFDVKDVSGFFRLFQTLHDTLQPLAAAATERPPKEDLETTRTFFQRLADLMLAQLSVPKEEAISIL